MEIRGPCGDPARQPGLGVDPKAPRCHAVMRLDNKTRDSHGGEGTNTMSLSFQRTRVQLFQSSKFSVPGDAYPVNW